MNQHRSRDLVIGYVSLSCQQNEHERCTIGPEKPTRPEEVAPRCACPHHTGERLPRR